MNAREPYFAEHGVTLHLGDCVDVMAAMPTASVDAVVCDPPYALAELSTVKVLEAIAAWMRGDRLYVPDGRGFMGRDWDRFVPPPGAWDECLRVLKPGGHLLAFAGSRTVDLMGLAIRIAGFEIRDSAAWIYGQGFPKSLDVGKAIDAAAGAERPSVGVAADFARDGARRDVSGTHALPHGQQGGHGFGDRWATAITVPATANAARWDGWGTALKPSHEPVIFAVKPHPDGDAPGSSHRAHEPIILARKPPDGTVAANVLAHGTGALNIDATRVDGPKRSPGYAEGSAGTVHVSSSLAGPMRYQNKDTTVGRWPANVLLTHSASCSDEGCTPGCPVAELDQQSGTLKSGANPARRSSDKFRDAYGEFAGQRQCVPARGAEEGGASRFFPVFRYEPKAPPAERPRLSDGTAWPTVKPVALMRWLVRLITPPGGTVLDPFCGTGATAEAAREEGFRCVLIEQDETAAQLAVRRLTTPKGQRNKPAPAASAEPTAASDVQLDLFGGAE